VPIGKTRSRAAKAKGKEPKRNGVKPSTPDGVPEDGCDGRPLDYAQGEDEELVIQPGNLWRCKPKVQIAYVKKALRRISNAMWRWNEVAAAAYVPGSRSEADEVLAGLWRRRTLRMNQLRWLRSEIPVDPSTSLVLEGEEEESEEEDSATATNSRRDVTQTMGTQEGLGGERHVGASEGAR
jgi:hypothetical protein